MRQIGNGNSVEIVPRINGNFIGAVFSPDSEQIYYSVNGNSEPNKSVASTLYKVSVLGGASREILHDIDSPAAFSPDKSTLAFVRHNRKIKKLPLC